MGVSFFIKAFFMCRFFYFLLFCFVLFLTDAMGQFEQGFNLHFDNGRPPCWGEGYGTFSVKDTTGILEITPLEGSGAFISGGDPLEGYAAVRSPFFEVSDTDSFSFYYNMNGDPGHTLRMLVYVQSYHDSVTADSLDYNLGEPLHDTISFQYNPTSWYFYQNNFGVSEFDTVRLVIKFFDVPPETTKRPVVDYLLSSANVNGDINSPKIHLKQTVCAGNEKSFFADIYRGDGSQDTSFPLVIAWYLNDTLVQEGSDYSFNYTNYQPGDFLQASFYAFSPCETDASADSFPWFSQRLLVEDCQEEFSVEINANASLLCEGTFLNLSVTVNGDTADTYEWQTPNRGDLGNSDTHNFTTLAADSGLYIVKVTSGTGFTARDTLHMEVYAERTVELSAVDTFLCEGELLDITAIVTGGPVDLYEWTTPNTLIGDTDNFSFNSVAADSGLYIVKVTYGSGCTARDTLNVEVYDELAVENIEIKIIMNRDTVLSANVLGGTPPYYFEWEPIVWLEDGEENKASPQTKQLTDSITFSVLVTDENECTGSGIVQVYVITDTLLFQGGLWPTDLSGIDTNICWGADSLSFSSYVSGGAGTYSFMWSTEPEGDTLSHDSILTIQTNATRDIRLTISDGETELYDSISIIVHDPPIINIHPGDGEYIVNEPIVFAASGGVRYEWEDNDFIYSDLTSSSVLVRPRDETVLYVKVSDEYGCQSEDSVIIQVSEFNWFVPQAFTPNNDGANDMLHVYGNGIKSMNFKLFNKWGQLVFETKKWHTQLNRSEGWNGVFEGNIQHNQTFGWMLHFEDINGQKYQEKGTVTLIR